MRVGCDGAWNCAAKLGEINTERALEFLSVYIEFHAFAGICYEGLRTSCGITGPH
jgi:hypothetical protein